MSTHRRGVRPSQWPVRDLLGPETVRARFWDARVGAAAAGLLACGAAVTVVLTSGGRAMSEQTLEAPGAPLALPAPAPVPAVPPPAVPPAAAAPQVAEPRLPARDVVAPHPRSARPQHRRAAPRHRPAAPAPSARDAPVKRDAAPRDGPGPCGAGRHGHRRVGGPVGAGRGGRRLAPGTGSAAGRCGRAARVRGRRRAPPRAGLRRSAPGPGSRPRAAGGTPAGGPWRPAPRAGRAPRRPGRPASRTGSRRPAIRAPPVHEGRRDRAGRGGSGRAGTGGGPGRACGSR